MIGCPHFDVWQERGWPRVAASGLLTGFGFSIYNVVSAVAEQRNSTAWQDRALTMEEVGGTLQQTVVVTECATEIMQLFPLKIPEKSKNYISV
jgi:hypothetical protein